MDLGLVAVLAVLTLGGGVARNKRLRELAQEAGERKGLEVVACHPAYCTDNAAMIAGLAWARLEAGFEPVNEDLGTPALSRSQVGA